MHFIGNKNTFSKGKSCTMLVLHKGWKILKCKHILLGLLNTKLY